MGSTTEQSMFAKIGGKPAVEAVVSDFYARLQADSTLAPFFTDTDMDKQKRHQVAFVSMALGGPNEYAGKAMKAAHEDMKITEKNFTDVAMHLTDALSGAGVGNDDVGTIIGVVAGLQGDVVTA